jgi:hypothetical protein
MTVVTLMTMICGLILDERMRLYLVGPYPFNLTRRTRRRGRKPHLYKASETITASGSSIPLITRRRYPTRRPTLLVGFVGSIVGCQTQNPTTTNTLLMPNTPAIVGFVGFVRRYERGYTGESGRRGIGRWCSKGPEDMV